MSSGGTSKVNSRAELLCWLESCLLLCMAYILGSDKSGLQTSLSHQHTPTYQRFNILVTLQTPSASVLPVRRIPLLRRTSWLMTLKVKDILEHDKKTPPPSGHQNKGAAIATSLQLIHRFRSGYTQRDVRPLDASAFLVSKPWNSLYVNFCVPNRNRTSVWQKKVDNCPTLLTHCILGLAHYSWWKKVGREMCGADDSTNIW